MQRSSKRTWLITGADSGLGYAMTKAALERGDRVAVTVLASDGRHPLQQQYADTLSSFHLDLSVPGRAGDVVARVEKACGTIDILVNNAGFGVVSVMEETPAEIYRPMFEVNFFGLVEVTTAVLPMMRKQRSGRIINISSLGGFGAAVPGFGFYGASKFAVEGYSEALAKEVAPFNIHVTMIEPGAYRTQFASSIRTAKSSIADYAPLAEMVDNYVTKRPASPRNDPEKFGQAISKLVDAEKPPLRLPLGKDATIYVREQIQATASELEHWAHLSDEAS